MSLVRSVVAVAIAFFSCFLGVAAEQVFDAEIAQTTVDSAGVSWYPTIAYESAVLTVSGPGDLNLLRDFNGNEALEFLVSDRGHAILEDGEYTWEIRFSPLLDPAIKKALADARENGDSINFEAFKKKGLLPTEPLVVSGYFRIKSGWIVVDETEAHMRRAGGRVEASVSAATVDTDSTSATKDQIILDDLIVDGSACIGQDCVNGESFGFDTIRIKENNLRIKAQDTSSTASFPSNDWQITFNDSSNGGANKFSIDDIDGGRTPCTVEASAPSHSLYVDDGGRIGFGTSTPVVDLHVKSGNTPTLRLEQDGSSGFTPQTWDVAGNETNFFIRDATNGSNLPFRIRPSAPSNSLYVNTDGNVGFGTASPTQKLHLLGSSAQTLLLEDTSVSGAKWYLGNSGDSTLKISADGTGKVEAKFYRNGNLTIRGDLFKAGSTDPYDYPDYVFSEDYQLLTLDELDDFIQENRHLPGVMSIDEVEASGGVNVTKLQLQVLEKIEELTLYLIEQQKRIRELESELASLREAEPNVE